jgi:hypothetical protein
MLKVTPKCSFFCFRHQFSSTQCLSPAHAFGSALPVAPFCAPNKVAVERNVSEEHRSARPPIPRTPRCTVRSVSVWLHACWSAYTQFKQQASKQARDEGTIGLESKREFLRNTGRFHFITLCMQHAISQLKSATTTTLMILVASSEKMCAYGLFSSLFYGVTVLYINMWKRQLIVVLL